MSNADGMTALAGMVETARANKILRRRDMDPDETLRQLREAARQNDGDAAIEYFEALDEWITNGGFLPASWAASSTFS